MITLSKNGAAAMLFKDSKFYCHIMAFVEHVCFQLPRKDKKAGSGECACTHSRTVLVIPAQISAT